MHNLPETIADDTTAQAVADLLAAGWEDLDDDLGDRPMWAYPAEIIPAGCREALWKIKPIADALGCGQLDPIVGWTALRLLIAKLEAGWQGPEVLPLMAEAAGLLAERAHETAPGGEARGLVR